MSIFWPYRYWRANAKRFALMWLFLYPFAVMAYSSLLDGQYAYRSDASVLRANLIFWEVSGALFLMAPTLIPTIKGVASSFPSTLDGIRLASGMGRRLPGRILFSWRRAKTRNGTGKELVVHEGSEVALFEGAAGTKALPAGYHADFDDDDEVTGKTTYDSQILVSKGHVRKAQIEEFGRMLTTPMTLLWFAGIALVVMALLVTTPGFNVVPESLRKLATYDRAHYALIPGYPETEKVDYRLAWLSLAIKKDDWQRGMSPETWAKVIQAVGHDITQFGASVDDYEAVGKLDPSIPTPAFLKDPNRAFSILTKTDKVGNRVHDNAAVVALVTEDMKTGNPKFPVSTIITTFYVTGFVDGKLRVQLFNPNTGQCFALVGPASRGCGPGSIEDLKPLQPVAVSN